MYLIGKRWFANPSFTVHAFEMFLRGTCQNVYERKAIFITGARSIRTFGMLWLSTPIRKHRPRQFFTVYICRALFFMGLVDVYASHPLAASGSLQSFSVVASPQLSATTNGAAPIAAADPLGYR